MLPVQPKQSPTMYRLSILQKSESQTVRNKMTAMHATNILLLTATRKHRAHNYCCNDAEQEVAMEFFAGASILKALGVATPRFLTWGWGGWRGESQGGRGDRGRVVKYYYILLSCTRSTFE